VNLLHQ